MALLKFFEGKESSYSSSFHSGGLYFAKDTGVILFKGVKYGSKQDLSNYALKSDIGTLKSDIGILRFELGNKSNRNHEHTIDDISDLIIANSDNDGLMPSSMYNKLDKLEMINSFDLLTGVSGDYVDILGILSSNKLTICRASTRISAASSTGAGLMSAYDKKKLDSLANTLQALSVQPINDSSGISPASLIGSDRYDILKGITDKHIGVNAQFTDGKITIGLYDFNKSEWVGAPSVTISLQ